MDDPLSLSVPGCIFLQTALGASPELNTAWGWNSPSSKCCWAIACPGLAALRSGRAGGWQIPLEPAAPSSAFVSTTKFPGTGAEFPCPNKGLGKQEFVQLGLLAVSWKL